MVLSFLCDNTFPHQVLSIKYDISLSLLPSRIFFWLPLLYSWCCFVIWTSVRFDSRKRILLGGLGLNSELCLLLHLPLLGFKRFIKRERERGIWVDKDGVLLRENKTKVVIAIGNYLNNSEDSRKADGELTNPCARMTRAQYASQCHHHDSTPSLWSHPCGHRLARSFLVRDWWYSFEGPWDHGSESSAWPRFPWVKGVEFRH